MVKIIIADNMQKSVIADIEKLGEVVFQPEDLKKELKDADALVVRSATKVTRELIEKADNLRVIARAGVGLDNIDLDACRERKIKVVNTPSASSNAVAEITIAMIINIMRKVGFLHYEMKNKRWVKKQGVGEEIHGKVLGVIGMGRIGRLVAKKATDLGMRVIYYGHDKYEGSDYEFLDSLEKVLEKADIVTFHASVSSSDPPMIGEKEIAKCKDGIYFVNFARGCIFDEKALIEGLRSKKIAGVALDVYKNEPYTGELADMDNVILTPHIGASTIEAQKRIGRDLIDQLSKELGI